MRVLDVGPGREPFPLATTVLEYPGMTWEGVNMEGREIVLGDVCDLPFPNQSFDFVWASHVLEHCQHPGKGIDELCRVGIAGMIAVPSAASEAFERYFSPGDCAGRHRWMFRATTTELMFCALPEDSEGAKETILQARVHFSWHGFRTELRMCWGPTARLKRIKWHELPPEQFGGEIVKL